MNRKFPAIWITLLIGLATPGHAPALSSDKDKPMAIEADSVEIDDKRGLTVYRGNVDVRQGTLHITGGTLVIERANGRIKVVTIVGKPATYRQRPDNKPEDVTAKAAKLQVYPERDLVRLERDAIIMQSGNRFSGNIIEYDNKNDIIKAKGDINQTDTGPKQSGRIRMIIKPR